MRKSTHNSKRTRKASIKRRRNRLRCLQKKHEDKINQLPNDILISIISRLTLQEATATSILSTRWRYLHTYITRLNFNQEIQSSDLIKERFPNYVSMIDHTLHSHRGGSRVKELKVEIPNLEGANFEKWLDFAFTKEVEIINIRARHIGCVWEGYFLGLSKLISWTKKTKCLKELYLSTVHVTDQDIHILISNFLALEILSINLSWKYLKNVSIVGHPKLKHLDISRARELQFIEICDLMGLVSLKFCELPARCNVQLRNVPKLIKFNIGGDYYHPHIEVFAKIPSHIRDPLQQLHLSTGLHPIQIPYELPFEFVNIKHLELEVCHIGEPICVHLLGPWIEACPSLEKLKIEFLWKLFDEIKFERRVSPIIHPYKKLSPNLKELEIKGYLGSPSELKLALYVINNAACLEKVIVVASNLNKNIRRDALARARRDFQPLALSSLNLKII